MLLTKVVGQRVSSGKCGKKHKDFPTRKQILTRTLLKKERKTRFLQEFSSQRKEQKPIQR